MRRLTSRRTYSIVFLSVLFLLFISFYSNKDFYKEYIIDKIYATIDFRVVFEDSSLVFFPSPGINLKRVTVHRVEEENKFDAEIKSAKFFFSWKILLGIIELNKIQVDEGKIELTTPLNLNKKDSYDKPREFNPKNFQRIFTFLNMDTILFQSVQFVIRGENDYKEEFYFNSLEINSDHISLIGLNFDLNYQDGSFKVDSKIQYMKDDYSFNSLRIESKWKINNFPLKPLKKYYAFVYGANFDNTVLNGEIVLFKEKFKNEYNVKTDLTIIGLHFLGAPIYPNITANSEFTYLIESKQINFVSISLYYPNGAIASANGTLTFAKDVVLNLNIRGEYADVYKVVYLILRSVDVRIVSNINFFSHLNIVCNHAVFDLYELKNINLELDVANSLIGINIHNADVLHGHLSAKGKVVAGQNTTYLFDVLLKDIHSELLIAKYSKNPYIKGILGSSLNFHSSGNSLSLFFDNLKSTGKAEVKKGELLGYANILKPIFSLGKLINILGPRGKNTEFQSLTLDYSVHNKIVNVQNLKMVGVGLDAHGKGNIGFDRKIDFRIYVGLGGIAGKALYIPILYKGFMPDNVSYIDPVWIGSVYVGATLFGGPAGATVGGITGSAVSEYVNKAWEGIKGFLSRD